MSDSSPENAPTVNDCLRMLTRRSVPNGQIQLYRALLVAGSKGATTAELVSAMGRRDAKDLTGALGALGNRINRTTGYGETQKPGIGMILRWSKADEGWRYYLKPVMREALAAHAPSWLPDTATSRWVHLVDLVRSRFPGWLGFEDPRFNQGPLDEVSYKLATVQEAEKQISEPELRRLIHAEEYREVIDRLIRVGTDNNLLWNNQPQRGDLRLLYHDGLDRAGYCVILLDLLYGRGDTPARLDRYVHWVSSQGLDSMNRWALPTYFLFFLDAEHEVLVKPQATRDLLKLGGSDVRFDAKPTGDDYALIRDAYRDLREALASYGPRHMIDVQSFGWVAQEEAEKRRKARRNAEAEGFVLDSRVEDAMKEFERTADAPKLIDQANRIEQAKDEFAEIFGSATKLRSLSPEPFVDFFNEVDSHGGANGIFSLNVVFGKDPRAQAFRNLQEDLPTLREALMPLLHGTGTPAARVDAMWDVGSGVRNYVAEGLTVASALLFIQDPEKASGVLPMRKKEEKLRATRHMPEVPKTATLGERFEALEQALTELPERYGRKWTPEARKEFYFSKAKVNEENEANGGNALPPEPSFSGLIEELRGAELYFSTEVVANYLLALQAKRFAILTGISGTEKTQIARTMARYFRRPVEPRVRELPGDAKEIRVVATNLEHDVIELPKGIGSNLRLPPTNPDLATARGRIRVVYPEGDTTLSFRAPQPGRVRLHPSGPFKKWFGAHLKPEDSYWLRVLDDDAGDYDRLEIGLPATRLVEKRSANYTVVPVRPDWVDNRGLLGYLNPITGAYSMTPFLSRLLEAREEEIRAAREERNPHPFFVVLDEMNLARVEHYFSDFLSALESEELIPLHDDGNVEIGKSGVPVPKQLSVPRNVFFTGTVNVDETTYMFSPKVLDRAFTIEFDRVDLAGYTDGVGCSEPGALDLTPGKDGALRFTPYEKPGRDDWLEFTEIARGRYARILLDLHAILEEEHRHFGYRVANEIACFVNLAREQSANGEEAAKAAFDLALLQKVLPKFHGTQQELESLLERLFSFAVHGGERRHGDTDVSLDEWTVENGRLTPTGKTISQTDVPAGTSQSDADGSEDETEGREPEHGTDAGDRAAEGPDPEFPRTAAKIWRMLRRLRQRGFTAFIE